MTNIDPAIVEALHEHRAAVQGIDDERGLIAWLTICKCGARIPMAEQGPAAHQADHLAPLIAAAADAARAEAWDEGYGAAYDFERGEVYPEPTNPYQGGTR